MSFLCILKAEMWCASFLGLLARRFILAIVLLFQNCHGTEPAFKRVYTIGASPIWGVGQLYLDFNATFQKFLTEEVGSCFDPPIQFRMVAVDMNESTTGSDLLVRGEVDFIYTSAAMMSCHQSLVQAVPLASTRSLLLGREMDGFGALIFARNDSKLKSIHDLKNAVISLALLQGTAFLLTWRVMADHGMNLMQDPDQLIFRGTDRSKVVTDVLDGKADAGLLLTSLLEIMDSQNTTKMEYFKNLHVVKTDYPFWTSTDIFPGWTLAAHSSVPVDIQRAVLKALLTINASHYAAVQGKYSAWMPAKSLLGLRDISVDFGATRRNASGGWRCLNTYSNIYDAISCPAGHFKRGEDEMMTRCEIAGRPCPANSICVCKPCKHAEEFELIWNATWPETLEGSIRCAKMAVCGSMEQGAPLRLSIMDNRRRKNLQIYSRFHDPSVQISGRALDLALSTNHSSHAIVSERLPRVSCIPDEQVLGLYHMTVQTNVSGAHLLEIFVEGIHIPVSPVFVRVIPRTCTDPHTIADASGTCICSRSFVEIQGHCIRAWHVIAVPIAFLAMLLLLVLSDDKAEDEEDMRLRIKVAELRKMLKITQSDGYFLSSERMPTWFKPKKMVFVQKSHLEAAARLAFWQEFDINLLDALCVGLQGDETDLQTTSAPDDSSAKFGSGKPARTPQYQSLCDWILDVCKGLLDPTKIDTQLKQRKSSFMSDRRHRNSDSPDSLFVRDIMQRDTFAIASSMNMRFKYFERKVSKIRIWRSDGEALFEELKRIVQIFMDQAACLCDLRFDQLCCESKGQELVDFQPSDPRLIFNAHETFKNLGWKFHDEHTASESSELMVVPTEGAVWHESSETICRQDHQKVGAIRVQAADRKEAAMELAQGTHPPSLLDEEVFLSQLFRRAELLNGPFNSAVINLIRSHAVAESSPMECLPALRGGIGMSMMMHCYFDEGISPVEIVTAPVKTLTRMREKLMEYAPPCAAGVWPLSANILDPVRLSVVCHGPSQMLQVARWFTEDCAGTSAGLPVVRIKNRFACAREQLPDGYRDLKIFVAFDATAGLGIIGEVQIHDRAMHDVALKMHKLYKIARAQCASKVCGRRSSEADN